MPPSSEKVEIGDLFEIHRDKIYRYLLHLVRNPVEAEDLAQETFLRAHRAKESLRDPEAIRGWLYRIATHVALDRLRHHRPHVSIESDRGEHDMESAVSRTPSAQEITERRETSACVQRCLDFLPNSYRAVILLYEGHSLSASEIAQLLGVSVGAVKIRLHRARRKLQQVMEQGCCISQDRQGLPTCQPKS